MTTTGVIDSGAAGRHQPESTETEASREGGVVKDFNLARAQLLARVAAPDVAANVPCPRRAGRSALSSVRLCAPAVGQQFVRVEHVHVNDGGQAVIGNVRTRGDGADNGNS
jgi:hypothetical protein